MSDDDYDEDFEKDYDEDFEAEEDYEVLPKTRGSAAGTPQPASPPPASPILRPNSATRRLSGTGGPPMPMMTSTILELPPAPKLTADQMSKARVRLAAAIKKMPKVQLEVVIIDELLIMASQTEYDLFHMGRGAYAGKKAGATQTGDDAKEEDCQTEEISVMAQICQAPDDRSSMTDAEVSASSVQGTGSWSSTASETAANPPKASAAIMRITHMEAGLELKLNTFMHWAGPVMLAALGIAPNSKKINLEADPHGGKGMGSGIVPLAFVDLLNQRPVTSLAFVGAANGEPLVLAAYGPLGAELGGEQLLKDHSLASKGCLCVWDVSSPSHPRAVLISEGSPSCCGFVPAPASHVVYAGMQEGGMCLWDIEEAEGRHPLEQVGASNVITRRPSYTSEGNLSMAGAGAPIVSVVAVPRGGSRVSPCYLYSLSAWGDITIWSVNVLSRAEAAAMDLDLGMRLGSCVRLLKVASNVRLGLAALRPPPSEPDEATGLTGVLQCSSLQVIADAPRQFLVAADGGRVMKASWAGLAPAPKEYVPHDHSSAAGLEGTGRLALPTCVSSLHISPICPWAFLTGHDDGTVTLHGLGLATAALVWPGVAAGGVKALRWSPVRPCVFFVLDAMCTILCFDLTKSRSGPTYSQSFMATSQGGASLATCFEVGSLSQDNQMAVQLPGFLIGYDDGRVDFTAFSTSYVQQVQSEGSMLVDIVGVKPA